jgi:hypothetical protein
MLDADRVVRLASRLGEIWCALVGNELQVLETVGGVGSDARDELGGLALVDGKRIEQAALAIADVLNADELEVDAEHAQIRGVAAELSIGRVRREIEAAGVAVIGGGARRRWSGGFGGGFAGRCCHERSVRSGKASAAQNSRAVTPWSAWSRSKVQTSSSWTARRRIGTLLSASSRVAAASSPARTGAR